MDQTETTSAIAAAEVAAADAGRDTTPTSRTHAVAAAMAVDAERYAGKLDHLADDTREGALTSLAGDLNENAAYNGDEWVGNSFDSEAVLEKLAQAVFD